jgi:hypothetical protein
MEEEVKMVEGELRGGVGLLGKKKVRRWIDGSALRIIFHLGHRELWKGQK